MPILRFVYLHVHCAQNYYSLKSCIKLTKNLTCLDTKKNEVSTMHSFIMKIFIICFLSSSLFSLAHLCFDVLPVSFFVHNFYSFSTQRRCCILCSSLLAFVLSCSLLNMLSKSFKQICRLSFAGE